MNISKIIVGKEYYTPSIVWIPVKVTVLEIDSGTRRVRIKQGWIGFNDIYETEEECPSR